MRLVDANVIVGLLIPSTPWSDDARALYLRDPDWHTEGHALVELTNVLVRLVRTGDLTRTQARAALAEAQGRLQRGLFAAEHDPALQAALAHGVSAYDARYLVAAKALEIQLITEDQRLRAKAPKLTQSVAQALAES